MAFSLVHEVKRVNFNLLWCNALALLAALALAGLPWALGVAKSSEAYFWYVLAAPLLLLSLWNLRKWLVRSQDLESHPLLEKIKGLGLILEGVDQDLDRSQYFLGFSLGRSWLLQQGFFKLELEALTDAIWAYPRVRHNGYLFYSQAVVHFRSGKSLAGGSTTDSKKVNLFLSQLSQTAPWVIMGENDDLSKLWKKDREEFAAQVDQRRKVLESSKRRAETPNDSNG
jgi:hypothetical protein